MKKALKIFGGVVAALVGLMLVSPILLKDKAKDLTSGICGVNGQAEGFVVSLLRSSVPLIRSREFGKALQ